MFKFASWSINIMTKVKRYLGKHCLITLIEKDHLGDGGPERGCCW